VTELERLRAAVPVFVSARHAFVYSTNTLSAYMLADIWQREKLNEVDSEP
jgi:hypothetical protein